MAEYSISEISANPIAEGVRFTLGGATAYAVRQESKDVALRIRRGGHTARQALARIPFVRGIARFVYGVTDLMGGLAQSADLAPQHITRGCRWEQNLARWMRIRPESLIAFGSGVLAVVILIGLLFALPLGIEKLVYLNPYPLPRPAENAIVCLSRIVGLLLALALVVRLRVMRRLRMYQGAINKVVNTYQGGGGHVTVEEAKDAFYLCPRCDMAFIALVLCLSVAAYAAVRTYTLPVQLLVRALLTLAIAGVVNEPVAAIERLSPDAPAAPLMEPLLWLQRLFVAEPHEQMVEVAVFAFNAARENDI